MRPNMKRGPMNSASSLTGDGCPRNYGTAAPNDIVREALAGRLHLQLLSRRNLGLLVVKLVEHAKKLQGDLSVTQERLEARSEKRKGIS